MTDYLGTAAVMLLYACAWTDARTSSLEWADENEEWATSIQVAGQVTGSLLGSWMWMILLAALLLILQEFVIMQVRAKREQGTGSGLDGHSLHGTALWICFGQLSRMTVLASLVASVVTTFLFAWLTSLWSMSKKGRRRAKKKQGAVRDIVSRAMSFNLGVVVTTLLLAAIPTAVLPG